MRAATSCCCPPRAVRCARRPPRPPPRRGGRRGRREPLTLKFGEVLHEPGVPIAHVYFPVDCVISLLARTEDGRALQVGLVGYEGMVDISLALGMQVSSVRALVQ